MSLEDRRARLEGAGASVHFREVGHGAIGLNATPPHIYRVCIVTLKDGRGIAGHGDTEDEAAGEAYHRSEVALELRGTS